MCVPGKCEPGTTQGEMIVTTKRPTEEQKQTVADDIKTGGPMATELATEEALGAGIYSGATPILDEAALERAEGGGPIAEAVREFDQEQANTAGD